MPLILSMEDQTTLKAWAAPRCDCNGAWPAHSIAMGVVDSETGAIRAVWVIVHTYQTHCDVHMASDGTRGWVSRNTLGGLWGYVFYILKVEQAQGIVGAGNTQALCSALKMGWEIETRLRNVMDDGGDGVMIIMHRDRCKWIQDQESDHG